MASKDKLNDASDVSGSSELEMGPCPDSNRMMSSMMGSYREISSDNSAALGDELGSKENTEEEFSQLSSDAEDINELPTDLMSPTGTRPKQMLRKDKQHIQKEIESFLDKLQGLVANDGDQVSFVAEDLNEKIKSSSSRKYLGNTSRTSNLSHASSSHDHSSGRSDHIKEQQLAAFNPAILTDLEACAKTLAISMNTMMESISGTLFCISSLTLDCVDTYRSSVCKTCDSVDANIKSIYQLMAKCEELNGAMKPMYRLSEQIKEIKRLLDLFDNVSLVSTSTS